MNDERLAKVAASARAPHPADGRMATGVEFDFMRAWQDIWRHRMVVLLVAGFVTIVAVAIAFLATPVYRVTTVLLPVEESSIAGAVRGLGDLGALAAMAGLGGAMSGDLSIEAEALLRSRKFTEDFIRERNLLPVLFADKWDARQSKWRVAADDTPQVSDGFQLFDRGVRRVGKDRRSGLVTLTIDWHDATVAADWANDLVRRVNEEMRARALKDTSATIAQLHEQLEATKVVPLQVSISELLEAQIKRQTFARVRSEFALRVVDPAVVPGDDEQVFPRRALLVVAGGAAGLVLGMFFAVVLGHIRRRSAWSGDSDAT
jgi:uncharacterized protein involved in exopolysaccharide biosynthesis